MRKNPFNLGLRFILEVLALFGAGIWGWTQHAGWLRVALVILLPVFLATVWSVFAVPDDPSRSGKTVVVTPGWLRLLLELVFFACGGWAFYESGYSLIALVFLIVVLFHYLFSWDRIRWLLQH